MKQKGFTLLEVLLSLSILSISFLALATCLESYKQQNQKVQTYKSLYPFIEAFQWFFHTYNNPDEPIEGIWLAYQTTNGKRKFLKQNQAHQSPFNTPFTIKVSLEKSFYKISFYDKINSNVANLYWSKEEE